MTFALEEIGYGFLTLRNVARNFSEADQFPVSARNGLGKEFVTISVEDIGVGIPEDIVSKVFDPFFTTKTVGKGTGLGLSQVQGFVHQAGGSIDLKSTLGEGTKVVLSLPKASVELPSHAEAAPFKACGTVLLVEDNPDVAVAQDADSLRRSHNRIDAS